MTESAEFPLFSSSILKPTKDEVQTLKENPPARTHFAYECLTEGCYSQFSETVFNLETDYTLESAQKWITFPGKHQVLFPLQTILPKVQMIRQVPPRHLPRDVSVDRRRRNYFKVRISQLLSSYGIPNSVLITPDEVHDEMQKLAFERNFFLPLFVFDDESFDSNSISGWFDTGFVEGKMHPLPAWAWIKTEDGIYSWEMAAVYSYDEESYLFYIVDLPEARTHQVYRIQLMFMAESPYKFIERIRYALEQRQKSEAKIRYQFFLDCSMFDGTPPMDQRLLERITILSLVNGNSTDNKEGILQSVTAEIRLNFQRVMFSYELQNFLRDHGEHFEFIKIPSKDTSVEKSFQFCSMRNDALCFTLGRQTLRKITLFYVGESIQAMLHAAAECVHIESFCLFSSNFVRAVPLTDFVTSQETNTSTVVKYLKYLWPENLSAKICLCLRSIGKGWLDLSISDWNVYMVSKISRFFLQVKLRMQESLQVLLEKSILNYSHLLNDPCLDFLDLEEDYQWSNDFRTTPFDRLHLPPVFKLIIHISSDGAYYSTDPTEFEPTVTKLLYTSLMSTCGIPIIDPDSLLNLDFARNLYIFTVELIEDVYIDHLARLHASYSKAVIPLNAYLERYNQFVEFHELVVDEFIKNFADANKTSQEVKTEILYQKEQKQELREILPEQIVIGTFQVIVEPLKKFLINKRIEIIRKLFLYYVQRMYNINEELLEELSEINGRLHEKLLTIEHLFEIREFMTLVPDKLSVLKERIQIMMIEYNVLDFFLYNLSDQQFSMKWEAFAWPYKISKRLLVMREEHKIDIEEFKRLQIRELASFQERLESLNEEIMRFSLQFDPDKALEVAVDAKKTWKLITDLQKAGNVLQLRQNLFEAEDLSLDYLNSIIESFSPYRAMWTACSDFLKLEEITIGNPLATIDLNETRNNLAELVQILKASVEVFAEKEEVKNVALVFLQKINDFEPVLITIECIKNENWLLYHWQEFSQKSGIEIKYTIGMNFSYCMKKGMLKHVALVQEIGARAVHEADAIRAAMEEEERLQVEAELKLLAKKASRKCRTDIL